MSIEHPAYAPHGVWHTLPLLLCLLGNVVISLFQITCVQHKTSQYLQL